MSTQTRIWHNHFHPAWGMLLVVAVVSLVAQLRGSREYNFFFLLQPLALCGFGGAMLWLGLRRSGVKRQRLAKELRGQLGGALLAVGGPSIVSAFGPGSEGVAALAFLFGLLILGAGAFGAEFDQKTMGLLLSAPGSRARIYFGKLIVLSILTGLATINFLFCIASFSPHFPSIDEVVFLFVLPVVAVCTGPYLSLKTRSTLAGSVFMVAVPVALVLVGQLGISLAARMQHPEAEFSELFGRQFTKYCWIALPLYFGISAVLGWLTFRRLELREGGGPEASGTHPLAKPLDRALKLFPPQGKGRWSALIGKELRLQVVPWLLAFVYLGLSLLTLLAERLNGASNPWPIGFLEIKQSLAAVFGFLTLLFCGAACVAEERQLGTMEWQLTLPMAMSKQWRLKVGTTLVLGLVLGVAWPLILFLMSAPNGLADVNLPPGVTWGLGVMISIGLMVIGIYASTISRNTIQAACVSAGLLVGMTVVAERISNGWAQWQKGQWEDSVLLGASHDLGAPPIVLTPDQSVILGLVVCWSAILFLAWVLLWLARRNFVRGVPAGRDVMKQLGIIGAVLVLEMMTIVSMISMLDSWRIRQEMIDHPYVEPKPAKRSSEKAGFGLNEELAKRYGIPFGTNATAAKRMSTKSGVQMDEELAKRYGLIVKTNTAPPK